MLKYFRVKLIFLPTLVTVIFIFAGCKEQKKEGTADLIIGKGQMPQATVDNRHNLHVVFGSGDSILYTSSTNNSKTFSTPVLIAVLRELDATAMRGPQIALSEHAITVIACDKPGNIYSYRKVQSGQWEQTARVNDVDGVSKEGLMALSADGSMAFATWLDLRDHHNKIYAARSDDGGKSWSANKLLYASPDSTVCECCKPSVVVKGDHVYVMFRNWLKGNRDMYLIQSRDGGNTYEPAQKLGTGSWPLNGCPMDGGGLAISKNGIPQTVWRRESKIFAAVPGAAEKELGEGKGCTIEAEDGKNIYAWTDRNDNIICLFPDGTKKIAGKGILPVLKAAGDGKVFCVWQHEKEIHFSIQEVL